MNAFWRNLVARGAVLAACAYIARATWRVIAVKRSGGCGSGCASCPVPDQTTLADRITPVIPAPKSFVPIDELLETRR